MPNRLDLILASSGLAILALSAFAPTPTAAQEAPQPLPPPSEPAAPAPAPRGYAQPVAPLVYAPSMEPTGILRGPFTLGLSFGGGSFATQSDAGAGLGYEVSGISLDFHVGAMFNQRLALLVDFWGVGGAISKDAERTSIHSITSIAARAWILPWVWLQGGVGWSELDVASASCTSRCKAPGESGAAVMGAVGVEVVQTQSFALDLSLRLGAALYEAGNASQASLLLGFNWY